VKLTSKYIIGEGEGRVSQFFLRLQSYSYGNMPNFKIVAYLLLGSTDSGGYVKFTPQKISLWRMKGGGGYQNVFKVPITFFW
jgi:hypothetical protein